MANGESTRRGPESADSKGMIKHYKAGSTLFREGEHGDRAYLIESGILEISTCSEKERFVLQMLGPGEIVGEMAIIDDAPRSATVVVIADAMLRVIDREQLKQRLQQADPILHMLMRLIMARYRCSVDALKKVPKQQWVSGGETIDPSARALDKFRMEADLRGALEKRQLVVFYQPIVSLDSGLVSGFEALVRWQQDPLAFIPPEAFIPLAEETNLIAAVDAFVFKQAVEDIQLINRCIGSGDYFVSINVSARHFADTNYLDVARDITRRAGLDSNLVEMEVTETQILDQENAGVWIKEARGSGFGVALDDFGTGYSSLSQLLSLDVDAIKIDRSFVGRLGKADRSDAMVQGIIALAKSMNLAVIAEGIETEQQESMLASLDCQFGQGFRLGRPMSVEHILAGRGS